jgi:DNA-binding Lrp family transcriptional regulator
MHKFNKQYLHPWIKIKDDKVIGGDRDPLKLSETQKKICKALLDKPTGKLNELGKTTKLTFKTLTKKIKELRKKRVIRTFEPIINHEKIGIDRKKILLKYESYDQRIENNLTSFCKLNPNIVSITKTFGSWDSIIDFESIKEERINEFINKLRETFEGIIASIEIIDVERTDKRIYLPSNHFS